MERPDAPILSIVRFEKTFFTQIKPGYKSTITASSRCSLRQLVKLDAI